MAPGADGFPARRDERRADVAPSVQGRKVTM